jgi:molecular chaperone DnaK (HSP70)
MSEVLKLYGGFFHMATKLKKKAHELTADEVMKKVFTRRVTHDQGARQETEKK